jgi:hypothetical protein
VTRLARALARPRALRVLDYALSRVRPLAVIWFFLVRFDKRVSVICISKDNPALVATLFEYFKRLGIELHVFLDGGSTDSSKSELEAREIPFASLAPLDTHHVEALVEPAARAIETEWLIRLDNDELLNVHALIELSLRTLYERETDCFAIRRSWVLLHDGRPCVGESDFIGPDHQWRLVRHGKMRFHGRIHTPAFDPPEQAAYLTDPSRLYHFDWVVRSEAYRREKVAFYASVVVDEPQLPTEPDVASEEIKLGKWYLPEDNAEIDLAPMREPAAERAASRFKDLAGTA